MPIRHFYFCSEGKLCRRKFFGKVGDFRILGGGIFETQHLVFAVFKTSRKVDARELAIARMYTGAHNQRPVGSLQPQRYILIGEMACLGAKRERPDVTCIRIG